MNQFPPIISISANGLSEAWYKAVKECLDKGVNKQREYGLTKDIISVIEINNPLQEPILHQDFPTKSLHLQEYVKQFDRGYNWKGQGFEYNYVDRLTNYPKTDLNSDHTGYYKPKQLGVDRIDQIKVIRDKIAGRLKKGGECVVSNRDIAITWVPERDLYVEEDQPCLQRIQIFVYSYPRMADNEINPGRAEFHLTWRSRDLYAAWNSNMAAITMFLDKEIFKPNNLKIIRCVDLCSSSHIYQGDWEAASLIKPPAVNLYGSSLSYEDN